MKTPSIRFYLLYENPHDRKTPMKEAWLEASNAGDLIRKFQSRKESQMSILKFKLFSEVKGDISHVEEFGKEKKPPPPKSTRKAKITSLINFNPNEMHK